MLSSISENPQLLTSLPVTTACAKDPWLAKKVLELLEAATPEAASAVSETGVPIN